MSGTRRSGRKPKPTAMKAIEGNPGRRPLNKREPRVHIGAPEMPAHVKRDKLAREKWIALVPLLLDMRVLSVADSDCLAGLCIAHSQFVRANKAMAMEPQRMPDPICVRIASDADKRLRSYFALFGLSPADRSKITAAPEGEEDELESFLSEYDDPANSQDT